MYIEISTVLIYYYKLNLNDLKVGLYHCMFALKSSRKGVGGYACFLSIRLQRCVAIFFLLGLDLIF